jgi:hypothetical protein
MVINKIRQYWPDEDPQAILAILNQYGTEEMERGRTRVHLAILKLSEGELSKLPNLVVMAKRDYRDVIAYAEYPEQMRLGFVKMRELSPEQRKALKKRDTKQYAEWLNGK